MVRPLACALVAFVSVAATPAHGADRLIVAIEAHSLVQRENQDLKGDLRALVQREVEGLDFSKAPRSARYTLSASLLKLDTSAEGGKARASARVSVVLKEARGGAVKAVLDGKAAAEASSSAVVLAERGALEAAVQGAVKKLPEAVRQAR